MRDKDLVCKGSCCCILMHGNSCLHGAGCGVPHQLRSVWCQRKFYLWLPGLLLLCLHPVSASPAPWDGRNVPKPLSCSSPLEKGFEAQTLEEGTEEQSGTQSWDLGVRAPSCTSHGGQNLLGIADLSVPVGSQSHRANPKKDEGMSVG